MRCPGKTSLQNQKFVNKGAQLCQQSFVVQTESVTTIVKDSQHFGISDTLESAILGVRQPAGGGSHFKLQEP